MMLSDALEGERGRAAASRRGVGEVVNATVGMPASTSCAPGPFEDRAVGTPRDRRRGVDRQGHPSATGRAQGVVDREAGLVGRG